MSPKDVLIADLYESVLNPEQIPEVLERINRLLDCDGLHLVGKDEDAGQMFASVIVGDRIAGAERDYLAHYHRIDPRLQIGLSSPTGVVVACHDVLDDRFVRRSEFYQDFLIPHGPRYVIGGNIYRTRGKNIHVAINHVVGRPSFSDEKRQAVSGYMYHLSRWATQLFSADELRGAAASGFFALEALGQGILMLDDRHQVLFANRAAHRLLGDVLLAQGFRKSWSAGAKLRDVFKQVSSDRQARTLTLTHPVAGQPTPLLFSLLPLPRDRGVGVQMPRGMEAASQVLGTPHASPGSASIPHASMVVLIRAQSDLQPTGTRLYQHAFGLTLAEARLAEALATGLSPQAHADQAGISIATVRTQIRALLAKTGAANLRGLVVLLASLPRTPG